MIPLFHGQINNGKITLDKKDKFNKYLSSLKNGHITVAVERWTVKRDRSLAQNRYYFGVVIKMLVEAGHFTIDDDAHDYLKRLFLKRGVDFKGKRYEVVGSTTTLSTIDFENYMEKCRLWAAQELGIVVPYPNEITDDSY